jgi:apolipoprotein N-acyltransferase
MLNNRYYMIRYLQIFLSGALGVLAFSPFDLWWMSVASLTYCIILFATLPQWSGFKVGFIYGLGLFGCGVTWLFNSLYYYGQAPMVVAMSMVLLGVIVLSLFPAIVFQIFSKLRDQSACLQIVGFVGLWVLIEWMRSWVFTGFPWLALGHSLVDSPLRGVMPIFGTYGGTAVIALLSVTSACLILGLLKVSIKNLITPILVIVACVVLVDVRWTQAASQQAIKVAAVQANIMEELKWRRDLRNDIYQQHIQLSEPYLDHDVIVWPETAIPTFYDIAYQEYLHSYVERLAKIDTEIVVGAFTRTFTDEAIFNSIITLSRPTQIYSKQHLVPFGEYLPLRNFFSLFNRFVTIPASNLSPGDNLPVMTVNDRPVGVSICYEAVFARDILPALPKAQWLINVTNDAWFGDSLAPYQHLQISRVRALETGRYMVRAANSGISAIINDQGELLRGTELFKVQVVSAEIWPMQGQTPFMIWSHSAILTIMLIGLIFVFVRVKFVRSCAIIHL